MGTKSKPVPDLAVRKPQVFGRDTPWWKWKVVLTGKLQAPTAKEAKELVRNEIEEDQGSYIDTLQVKRTK